MICLLFGNMFFLELNAKEESTNKIMFDLESVSSKKVKVWIFLDEIDKDMVHRELNNQNYNVEYYENRDNFYHNVVPMTNERAEIKYGTVKAHEPASILEFDRLTVAKNYYATTNDNVIDVDSYTLADYELVDEVNNYLYIKRQIVKKFGVKQISSFINKHQLDSNNIIYNGFIHLLS